MSMTNDPSDCIVSIETALPTQEKIAACIPGFTLTIKQFPDAATIQLNVGEYCSDTIFEGRNLTKQLFSS